MKILALDMGSNLLDWLMRCQRAGHEVMWYDQKRKDGSKRLAGEGIVPKLHDYDELRKKWIGWADLIVFADNAHYTDLVEPYRKIGYPVFGPSPEAADLELNRKLGQDAMKKAGLKTIPGVTFDDYDRAAKFVEKHPTYLVSKPSGDADKALSFVADDAASLVHMLTQRWKKNDKYRHDAKKYGFILQEKVDGVEMAVGGWFGPHGWGRYWYENFEYKKLMNGDLGPNTGEMGTLSRYTRNSKLANMALKPMTETFKRMDYVGFCDIAGMIDDSGEFWPFEFTMRPGWPTFHNQVACHQGDPAQWMVDCLNGKDTLECDECHCVSVVIAIPDFPYSHLTNKEVRGIPIYDAGDMDHVHLSEVMMDDDVPAMVGDKMVRMPGIVSAGDYIAVVTGTGDTITGARRSAYTAAKKIRMPNNPFYRTDIGVGRMIKGLPRLQKLGFATGFKMV